MSKFLISPHIVFFPLLFFLLFSGCRRLIEDGYVEPALECKYDSLIATTAASHGLDPELLKAVIWRESRFRYDCIGQQGELGLMQLMWPAIEDWSRVNKEPLPTEAEVLSPGLNIEIGAWYLSWCGRRFSGAVEPNDILRLAIYNAGYGRVRKWLPDAGESPRILRLEDISFPMTRDYITTILRRAEGYRQKKEF